MADIKISELGAASAVNATDLFPITSAGVTVKATAQQIKNYMGVGNLTDLSTTDKSSHVAAINEVDSHADNAQASANVVQAQVSNSGNAYSPSKPYQVGDLCIYNNVLYRCITACSAGSWTTNQSCFTADTLTNIASSGKDINVIKKTSHMSNRPDNQMIQTIVIEGQSQMEAYGVNSVIVSGMVTGVTSYVALLGYNYGIVQGMVSFGPDIYGVQYVVDSGNLTYYKMSH